jgi:ParB family chromosome partitioning protein
VEVRDGQRRTLAAREAGLVTIPVYVLTAGAADTNTVTGERIAEQIVTNDQRYALTDAQRVAAGLEATGVVLQVGADVTTVSPRIRVTESPPPARRRSSSMSMRILL